MKNVYIVDGNNIFYRAFFGMKPLSFNGQDTRAIYGFFKMLLSILTNNVVDELIICFDQYSSEKRSHRYELLEEYKANRSSMPDELRSQVPIMHKLCNELGLTVFKSPGIEADDMIYSAVNHFKGNNITIVSSDKDLLQLVSDEDNITQLDTMKALRYNAEQVYLKMGVKPTQIDSYLALVGDASDNVPGVKGVGPKAATKLLSDYESLDEIYLNLDKIKGALNNKLTDGKDNAFLSLQLVQLVAQDIQDVLSQEFKKPDKQEVVNNFQSYGMRFLGSDIYDALYGE